MRCIIAGSRTISDLTLINKAVLKSGWLKDIALVISGGARGVDKTGEQWAATNNIPIRVVPAHWEKYGKSAGYRRNLEMADDADILIAVWDGQSEGTKHMIDIMQAANKPVFVFNLKECQNGNGK